MAVQALGAPKAGGATLRFDAPRRWRPHFLAALEPRLQAITLPALLRAGATAFCWLGLGLGLGLGLWLGLGLG